MSRLTLLQALAVIAAVSHGAIAAAGDVTGDTRRGAELIAKTGCGTCHAIKGIADARGMVGPPLDNMGARTIIAGMLPNTPENMERWLQSPQSIVPGNAMPNLGLSDRAAADITAYLESLK